MYYSSSKNITAWKKLGKFHIALRVLKALNWMEKRNYIQSFIYETHFMRICEVYSSLSFKVCRLPQTGYSGLDPKTFFLRITNSIVYDLRTVALSVTDVRCFLAP
jgi:hypothetical protein